MTTGAERAEGPGARHVLHVFQPRLAGVPAYVATLAKGLAQAGWRVTVAMPADAPDADRMFAALPVETRRYPMSRGLSPRQDARVIRDLARFCEREAVDVVHGHSSKASLLSAGIGRSARIPSIYTPHGWAFEMRVPLPIRLAYAGVERVLARHFHSTVMAVSDAEIAIAERWKVLPVGARSARVYTSPPVAPTGPAFADRDALRAHLGLPSGGVVGWVGRNDAQKRPQDLAPLAQRLGPRGITLVCMGAGLEGSEHGVALAAAGGRLVPQGESVESLYAASDVLAQTSDWEGLPQVLLEGMRAGLPVVAYDVGGISEAVVDGHTGFLMPARDLDGLADHCVSLVEASALRSRMGAAGRRRVAAVFGARRMAAEAARVYEAAIGPS